MLDVLAAAVGVLGVASGLDVPAPPDMGALIQQFAQQFTSMATIVLTTVNSTVLEISRLAYISILLIGVLLYFTHAERRLGKDLIKGAILLAVFTEIVFPFISSL